jgi:hypothetical protein
MLLRFLREMSHLGVDVRLARLVEEVLVEVDRWA